MKNARDLKGPLAVGHEVIFLNFPEKHKYEATVFERCFRGPLEK